MSTESTAQETGEYDLILPAHQDYEAFESDLKRQWNSLVDRNGSDEELRGTMQRIDDLYNQHVLDTHSSVILREDQQALLHLSDICLARAKNQVLGESGTVSVDTLLNALRVQATQESGVQLLSHIGELFIRGAGTAVLPSSMPDLAAAERRKGHTGRGEREQPTAGAAEPSDITLDNVITDDHQQQVVMQKIEATLAAYERINDYEPILLYELCLQRDSFAETMENMFFVSVLVSLGKLWVMPSKRGLPLVGTMRNRESYRQTRGGTGGFENEQKRERKQFNFNMNYKLWLKLCELYKEDGTILERRRAKDTFDSRGRTNH